MPSLLWFLPFALLFSLQVLPRLTADSPAGDEMVDIGDGYYYWKGDVISDQHHPPLAKALQALPLYALGVKDKAQGHFTAFERRDYNFLFVLNRDRFESLVLAGRLVTFLFGLGLGLLLFLAARELGREAAFFTLALWVLEPNLLAYSGLLMADIPLCFFLLAAAFSFRKMGEKPGWKGSIRTGLISAMAVTTKFSAAILAPVFLILEFLRRRKKAGPAAWRGLGMAWGIGLGAALLWVCLLYLPGTLRIPGSRSPLSYFWEGFSTTVSYSGHPTFFLGELAPRNHWAYYPVAFLLKSPLPFLFFLLTAAWAALTRRIQVPAWQWLTPALLFAAVLPFLNLGIRQVLPIYPFLILVAAQGAQWLWGQSFATGKRTGKILAGGLLAFQALSVLPSFPAQVAYLNELVSPDKRLYYLGDSNLDLGQDTKRLARTARLRGWKNVKLAYFGVTDPGLYGMQWAYWTKKDLAGPQPGWVYAVNVSYLQLGPAYFPDAAAIDHSWITQRTPTGTVGSTWVYFEISGEAAPDDSPALASAPPFRYFGNLNQ
jgi:hypothetical protein